MKHSSAEIAALSALPIAPPGALTAKERTILKLLAHGGTGLPGNRRDAVTLNGGRRLTTSGVMADLARRGLVKRDRYGHWHATEACRQMYPPEDGAPEENDFEDFSR